MNKNEFYSEIMQLCVIDTHEHFRAENCSEQIDVFDMFMPYVCDNLLTAGMEPNKIKELWKKDIPFKQRFDSFQPFLEDIQFTTYFQAILKTLKDQYDMTDFTYEQTLKINQKMNEENQPGVYDILFKKNKIETVFSFVFWYNYKINHPSIHEVPTVSDINIKNYKDFNLLQYVTKQQITDIDCLKAALENLIADYINNNVKAIKFGTAYRRKLDFKKRTTEEVSQSIDELLHLQNNDNVQLPNESIIVLDDFITDYLITLAEKNGLKIFFHIGMHAWNENQIDYIHSSYLVDIIRRHPNATFIILHCGMPFIDEAILLCKYYRNVYLNMTWCHIIEREQSKQLIKKCIEHLPISKIMGFGGDYCMPQQIYGHLLFAKQNIAEALWDLVEDQTMNEQDALKIASCWLYYNCKNILQL